MSAENEFDKATVADERNPFATPERVAETSDDESNPFATPERVAESADAWEGADAPPTVGPSFRGAFWYCLRHAFDFKGRANRTEYFGWLAGLAVACFTLGVGSGVAQATSETYYGVIVEIVLTALAMFGFWIPGAAALTRRLRDQGVFANARTAAATSVCLVVLLLVAVVLAFLRSKGDISSVVAVAAVFIVGFLAFGAGGFGWCLTLPGVSVVRVLTGGGFWTLELCPVAIGIALRVLLAFRAGTPGPNRFGAERITPKEAARREREKNNGVLNVENKMV